MIKTIDVSRQKLDQLIKLTKNGSELLNAVQKLSMLADHLPNKYENNQHSYMCSRVYETIQEVCKPSPTHHLNLMCMGHAILALAATIPKSLPDDKPNGVELISDSHSALRKALRLVVQQSNEFGKTGDPINITGSFENLDAKWLGVRTFFMLAKRMPRYNHIEALISMFDLASDVATMYGGDDDSGLGTTLHDDVIFYLEKMIPDTLTESEFLKVIDSVKNGKIWEFAQVEIYIKMISVMPAGSASCYIKTLKTLIDLNDDQINWSEGQINIRHLFDIMPNEATEEGIPLFKSLLERGIVDCGDYEN